MYLERDCSICFARIFNCFAKLPPDDLAYISSFKSSILIKRGHNIYNEGRLPQGVFCLNEGKVKIYRLGNDGKEHVTRIVTPSSFFGLRALISGSNYTTSAITLEDSVICMIPKRPFLKITLKYPEVSHCLMVYLATLLDDAESKLMSLAQKPIRERLAETLVTLNDLFNKNGGEDYINLSRTDIANIVGTANECVIRLLSEFKDDGLIFINGRKIGILDLNTLKKIARIL
jgi:CRP/FNR family transcriptional regulator